jgi:hypothetical protein
MTSGTPVLHDFPSGGHFVPDPVEDYMEEVKAEKANFKSANPGNAPTM